jgi:hypothetical protein
LINKFRPRLTADEAEVLQKYRAIKKASDAIGINDADVKHGWLKNDKASLFFKNPNFKQEELNAIQQIKDECIKEVKKYAPKYTDTAIKYDVDTDGHLLVIDIADLHIGKLATAFETGEDYNSQIAVKRAKDGMQGILNKAKGFYIDKVLFVAGNDILHTDNTRRTTTGGTPQDTDGMWYDNFLMAKNLYIELLEQLIIFADVEVVYNPSNHDLTHGFFLMQLIEAHFANSTINFNVNLLHRKAFKYGNNLIGTTHGDGAKIEHLPLLLATEFPILWSETKHRYIYSHHIHHKTSKDFIGVTFETLRSPSGSDSWHHKNGYTGVPKAVEGYIHHKEFGQVARITHIFSVLFLFSLYF